MSNQITNQGNKRQSNDNSKLVKIVILTSSILLMILLLIFGSIAVYQMSNNKSQSETQTQSAYSDTSLKPEKDGNKSSTNEELTIASSAKKGSPSVVSVLSKQIDEDSFLGPRVAEGAGSGVIVSSDGYILTNKHVVEGASTVTVVMANGSIYSDVKVIASDPLNDLAFLKVPKVDNLPVAEIGDSATLRVGQQVIAIGNSLGQYQNTVTSGIISGKERPISAAKGNSVESLTDLLQTDAAINPGNSGGPLLNTSGQVIGINTAIAEDAEGIGFAIPINAAKGILKQVLATGSAKRAYLGVNYVPLNAAIAKQYNLSVAQGAFVKTMPGSNSIANGSPADKAGLKDGDVITKIDDSIVGPNGGVSSLIAAYAPDEKINLEIKRGDRTLNLSVRLTSYQ